MVLFRCGLKREYPASLVFARYIRFLLQVREPALSTYRFVYNSQQVKRRFLAKDGNGTCHEIAIALWRSQYSCFHVEPCRGKYTNRVTYLGTVVQDPKVFASDIDDNIAGDKIRNLVVIVYSSN